MCVGVWVCAFVGVNISELFCYFVMNLFTRLIMDKCDNNFCSQLGSTGPMDFFILLE